MRGARRVAFLVTAAVMIAALPLTAEAKPLERARYQNTGVEEIEDFCGIEGLTVLAQFEDSVNVTFNPQGKTKIAYFTATPHGWASWTNVANGKTMTLVWNFVDKDQKITDNGDGTLTIRIMNAGSSKVYGSDGKLLFNDPGQIQFEVLVDHGGTPADPSDDEFIAFLGLVKGSTGRNDLQGRDFCEDIQIVIG